MSLLKYKHHKFIALFLSVGFFVLSYFVFSVGPLGWHDRTVDTVAAVSETISCNATGSRTLTAGTYSNSDGSQFTTGADLTLNVGTGADCTFTFNGTMTVASLVVDDGVILTHSANTSTQVYTLDIQSSGSVTVNAGGAIVADGKGYAGGTYGTSTGNGAGYGGGISSGFGGPGTSTSTYTDSYSTGNRAAIISVTGTVSYNGSISILVDGNKAQNVFYFNSATAVDKYIRFTLASPRIFTEAIFYQDQGTSHGTYMWQGSNNGTDWTTIGSSFTLGQSTAQTQTSLSANTTAYSYYQLYGTANYNSTMPWVREFEFKVLSQSSGGGGAHVGTGGVGGNTGGVGGSAYSATTTIASGGGAGGATGASGGAGGGLISITASSTITINGILSANGATGTVAGAIAGGGGGGGTIYLNAQTVTGTPQAVSVTGGAGGDTTYDGGGGGGGLVAVSYANTTTIRTANTSVSGGIGNVSGGNGAYYSAQFNVAPTASALSSVQSSTSTVLITTTVADLNSEATSLVAQYSLDGTTWVSSTLRSVTASSGSVTASTGLISGIDTDTSDITLSILWDIIADIPNTADSAVYFRVIPADATVTGSTVTSEAFAVDTQTPSAPDISTSAQTINADNITITGTAESGAIVTISGGASTATGTATGGNYSISVSLTQDATNTISVTAADSFSNTSTPATVVIVEDSTAPATPVIATSAQTLDADNITITGTAESGAIVTISGGASTATGTATGGNYSISVSLTQNSANTLSVTASDVAANTSTAASVIITEAVTTSGGSGGQQSTSSTSSGVAASTSVIPILQIIAPTAVPVPPITQNFSVNKPTVVSFGDVSHTVTVRKATDDEVNVLVQSEPVLVTLKKGQTVEIDTDGDKIVDLKVGYGGLSDGKPKLDFNSLVVAEKNKPMTINDGAKQTTSALVTLNFTVKDTVLVAVSNRADFSDSYFEKVTPTRSWTLSSGEGTKTVYARFRTAQGQMVTVSDTIEKISLISSESKPVSNIIPTGFTRELRLLSVGEDVRKLQMFLKEKGYFAYPEFTTKFGAVTQAGLKKYQASVGLKQTGVLDVSTRASINTALLSEKKPNSSQTISGFTRELRLLSVGEDVRKLQMFLKEKGYFAYPEFTTKFGAVTQAGLKKYQASVGLKQTGVLDVATRGLINQSL